MFDRWIPYQKHSQPYVVFQKYIKEVKRDYMSFKTSRMYVYKQLKSNNAKWTDAAYMHFSIQDKAITLKDWSKNFKKCEKWFLLNQQLAITSILEIYFTTIIKTAFYSNPALLLGYSHSIDGLKFFKYQKVIKDELLSKKIEDCVKGEWSARVRNIKTIFDDVESIFSSERISILDKNRNLRNNIAHSFGRNLNKVHDVDAFETLELESFSEKQFYEYINVVCKIVEEVDIIMMNRHIGNFLPIKFLIDNYEVFNNKNQHNREKWLKENIRYRTNEKDIVSFVKWIIEYVNAL